MQNSEFTVRILECMLYKDQGSSESQKIPKENRKFWKIPKAKPKANVRYSVVALQKPTEQGFLCKILCKCTLSAKFAHFFLSLHNNLHAEISGLECIFVKRFTLFSGKFVWTAASLRRRRFTSEFNPWYRSVGLPLIFPCRYTSEEVYLYLGTTSHPALNCH